MSPSIVALWAFFPIGYVCSVLIETPILLLGLSKPHPFRHRLFAGLWLTACTYPIVVLVLPVLLAGCPEYAYVLAAESFAPLAEAMLFFVAFRSETVTSSQRLQDVAVIVIANIASFLIGLGVF